MNFAKRIAWVLSTFVLCLVWTGSAAAFPTWDAGCNNGTCHGDFTQSPYVPPSGGESWADSLHNVHRNDMLGGDCNVCHPAGFLPVSLNASDGGAGLDPISCAGCHSRAEPDMAGEVSGVGLRQHHFTASGGTIDCLPCHSDANPANFTPVGENVPPPYYANPGTGHPNIPDDPCNPAPGFPEEFAGSMRGLDNDGDGLYDADDVIDCPEPTGIALQLAALGALGGLAARRRAHRS